MRKILFFTAIIALGVSAMSYQIILKTSLEIKILNRLGSTVSGVEVKIYDNKEDYVAGKNQIGITETTDKNGKVLFKDLKAISYFVSAKKGELNNFGDAEVTDTLTAGRRNKVTIIIN